MKSFWISFYLYKSSRIITIRKHDIYLEIRKNNKL